MLEYDRINISEGIDANKIRLSKKCDICHYWYFTDIFFLIWAISLLWLPWFNAKNYEF